MVETTRTEKLDKLKAWFADELRLPIDGINCVGSGDGIVAFGASVVHLRHIAAVCRKLSTRNVVFRGNEDGNVDVRLLAVKWPEEWQ